MIRYSTLTNKGTRQINEDSVGCFSSDHNHCFVVCDGLGGHGMGDVASQLVVKTVENQFQKVEKVSSFISETLTTAQESLLSAQKEMHAESKMKTTCVMCFTDEKKLYAGFIGDSRMYVFNKNKIRYRTLDHSIPQMLVITKEISEKEIRFHPDRNIVLRVMGVGWEKPMFELLPVDKMRKCQALLLCTDGFWELICEEDMCATLAQSASPEEWLQKMSEIIIKTGEGKEMDNYSAIAVWNM